MGLGSLVALDSYLRTIVAVLPHKQCDAINAHKTRLQESVADFAAQLTSIDSHFTKVTSPGWRSCDLPLVCTNTAFNATCITATLSKEEIATYNLLVGVLSGSASKQDKCQVKSLLSGLTKKASLASTFGDCMPSLDLEYHAKSTEKVLSLIFAGGENFEQC